MVNGFVLILCLQIIFVCTSIIGYLFDECTQGSYDLFKVVDIFQTLILPFIFLFLLFYGLFIKVDGKFVKYYLLLLIIPAGQFFFSYSKFISISDSLCHICGNEFNGYVQSNTSEMLNIVYTNLFFSIVLFFIVSIIIIKLAIQKYIKNKARSGHVNV
jgi:hypothetical protein